MQPLPHVYSVTAIGGVDGDVSVNAAGLSPLASAAPLQFDGPGDQWSPESLLVAAVASCFVLTFRAMARASRLQWTQLDCAIEATLDRVDGPMQFTKVATHATLTVPDDAGTVQCERVLTKAEEGCLIANSLRARRELHMEIIRVSGETASPEASTRRQHIQEIAS